MKALNKKINTIDYEEICKTALKLTIRIDDIITRQRMNGVTIQELKAENKSMGQEKGELERQRHSLLMGLK